MISRRVLLTILAAIVTAATPGLGQTPAIADRSDVQITSMSINSSDDDFAPVALRGGSIILFTSSRSGSQRIWRATRGTTGWDVPAPEGEILGRGNEVGATALTPDGNFMVFAAYEWSGDGGMGSGRTDLYSAERVGGEWTKITNLGPAVNSEAWDSQPSLSADGRTLYFASDRPGGRGGTDIYVSRRTASGWTRPVNIGDPVNTQFDDMTPSIAPDGKALFFSSMGHGGLGGFDLFAAKGGAADGTGWRSLENLGAPINSASNDHYYLSVPNSNNSYFASDRAGSLDIYIVSPNPFPPEALVTVSGTVIDATTRQPLAAHITVTDLSSGEVVGNYNTDGRDGAYYVVLTRGRRYAITATAPDYIFYSDEYSVGPSVAAKDVKKDIELYPTGKGSTRLLVFFDYDKSELKNESKPDLNRAAEFLAQNPEINVEIAGHTDSVGNAAYNQRLSQSRAEAVIKYLTDGGIPARRLSAKGYGEDRPIDDNGTEEGRARNRRVEMRVKE